MKTHFAMLMLVPSLVFAADSKISAKDVSAIRGVDAAYVHAVLSRDWDGLVGLLTTDAVVMPPNGQTVVGRGPNLTRLQNIRFSSVDYAHDITRISGNGSVAYLQGTFTLKMVLPEAPQPFVDEGKHLWVLRKQPNGRWLIERIIWNSSLPAKPNS
jgi:ketosteroid isomerase-like protein